MKGRSKYAANSYKYDKSNGSYKDSCGIAKVFSKITNI